MGYLGSLVCTFCWGLDIYHGLGLEICLMVIKYFYYSVYPVSKSISFIAARAYVGN